LGAAEKRKQTEAHSDEKGAKMYRQHKQDAANTFIVNQSCVFFAYLLF
jgi:hypothetical protein